MQGHERIPSSLNGFPTSLQIAKSEIARRQSRLGELRARQAIALQIPSLLSHPGFRTFLQEVAKLRDQAIQHLMTGSPDTATMMSHRERAVALDEVLAIIQHHEDQATQLAEMIQAEEKALA